MKKIDIYIDGVYKASTEQARTCKEVKSKIIQNGGLSVATPFGVKFLEVNKNNKIIVEFSKN